MDKYRKLLDELWSKYIEMTWEDKIDEKRRISSDAKSSVASKGTSKPGRKPKIQSESVDTGLLTKRRYVKRKRRKK